MQEALLKYEFTSECLNIGDYVQSLAARQFLNDTNPILICRESLNEFNIEQVKLIMNGWFLLSGENYPPSDKIKPLILSHHINISVQEQFKRPEIIDFYKKNEPIGCRDYFTLEFLKSLDINCYYSGCLTLTLDKKYLSTKKTDKIYFVDVRYKRAKGIIDNLIRVNLLLTKFTVISKIRNRFIRSNGKKSWKKTLDFYRVFSTKFEDEVLVNAEYIKHYMSAKKFKNDAEIFSYAEDLLHKYASAKYVVTSRIHCALPSLSLQTPTLYVDIPSDSNISSCRLNGIKELFHVVYQNHKKLSCDLLKPQEKFKIDSKFTNKEDYIKIKNNLLKLVSDFV